MNLFTPNTGDKKMDEAYVRMQEHVSKCKSYDDFQMHFKYIVKTDDLEVLNNWLLKVIYVNLKYVNTPIHDFDRLLECVDDKTKKELKEWLRTTLERRKAINEI